MQQFPLGGLKRFGSLLVLAALAAVGCGGSGSVSGKVVYNGTTVKGGTVMLVDSTGKAYSSPIAQDGTYQIDKVPTGDVKVMVETKSIEAASKIPSYKPPAGQTVPGAPTPPDPEEAKRRYVPIPDKYQSVETTDLTYTVKSGSQPYDPPLK
jgi:hypothetical protein